MDQTPLLMDNSRPLSLQSVYKAPFESIFGETSPLSTFAINLTLEGGRLSVEQISNLHGKPTLDRDKRNMPGQCTLAQKLIVQVPLIEHLTGLFTGR